MGLFDGLKKTANVNLTSEAALLLGCITMIAADGSIDEDELAIVRRIDGPNDSEHWVIAQKTWKQHDFATCAGYVCDFIAEAHILPLFANLIDIAMADGELEGDEQALLEEYVNHLKPDDSTIQKMVEVIQIKNSVRTG